jgi:hypothetical protein
LFLLQNVFQNIPSILTGTIKVELRLFEKEIISVKGGIFSWIPGSNVIKLLNNLDSLCSRLTSLRNIGLGLNSLQHFLSEHRHQEAQ